MNLFVITAFLLVGCAACQLQQFNNIHEFIKSRRLATLRNPPTEHGHRTILPELTDFMLSIGAVVIAITGLAAVCLPVSWLVRCVKNGGHCKSAWCCPKSPAEYRRRRETAQNRLIALDRLATSPINLDSSA